MKPVLALSLILPLGLGSCDKVVEVVKKAAAPAKTEAEPAPTSPPLLDRLKKEMDASHAAISPPSVQNLNGDDYDAFIGIPGPLVVVSYYTEDSSPCKKLGPVLDKVASEFAGNVSVGMVNVASNAALARKENVTSVPDVRLFREGRQVARFVGVEDEARIRGMFKMHAGESGTTPVKPGAVEADATPGKAPAASIERMSKDWMPPGMQRR